MTDLREYRVPIRIEAAVQLQHVAVILVAVTAIHHKVVFIVLVGTLQDLLTIVRLGQHIERYYIGKQVIVEVGNVETHRVPAHVREGVFTYVAEGPVAIIEVEIVLLMKIVAHQQVGPAITIEIANGDTEAEVITSSEDACLAAHVGEMAAIVAIEPVPVLRMTQRAEPAGIKEGRIEFVGMIQQEQIEIAIAIIIKKCGLAGIGAGRIDAIFSGLFRETGDVVSVESFIDEELLGPVLVATKSRIADIDIEQAIAIDIDHGGAGLPSVISSRHTRARRNIFEFEITLVDEELRGSLVTGNEYIRQSIVIQITHRHTVAIVIVLVGEHVVFRTFGDIVYELDTGLGRGQ